MIKVGHDDKGYYIEGSSEVIFEPVKRDELASKS